MSGFLKRFIQLEPRKTLTKCALYSGLSDDHGHKLSKRRTWKKRYTENSAEFDWLLDGQVTSNYVISFMNGLERAVRQEPVKVMDLGCGSSSFSRILYQKSPKPVDIISLDYAESAVIAAKKNFQDTCTSPGVVNSCLSFITADARNMPFKDNHFNIVVDKGTMDSVLKHQTLGDDLAQQMAFEIVRVLKVGGHILQFTDEDPDLRLSLWDTIAAHRNLSSIELKRTFKVIENEGTGQSEMFVYIIEKTPLEPSSN